MSETTTQALIRIVRLAIVAVIGVIIANAAVLINLIPDDNTKYLVGIVLIPLLDGIAKLIGGPTQQGSATHGRALGSDERPSVLSV